MIENRKLTPLTPIYFTGENFSAENQWSGLPALLRAIAAYLEANPKYSGITYGNLNIKVMHDEKDDNSWFEATLFAHEDDEFTEATPDA